MNYRVMQIVFGVGCVAFIVAWGRTAFIGCALGFVVMFSLLGMTRLDKDERAIISKHEREDREAIDTLRKIEDFGYLRELREETNRRHIIETWEKL